MIVRAQYIKKIREAGFRFSIKGLNTLEKIVDRQLTNAIRKARKDGDTIIQPEHFTQA